VNSSSLGKEYDVPSPHNKRKIIIKMGKGAAHSLTIGATIVIDLAIIPAVPTEVFRLCGGKILSSVKDTCVVVIKEMIMPILRHKMIAGISFSSNFSFVALSLNPKTFIYTIIIPIAPRRDK